MSQDIIYLSFDHLTVLFTITLVYSASLALITAAIVKTVGWTRPYTKKRELILQWGPALASAIMGAIAAPFVYSLVVMQVSGLQWHLAGLPVGFMAGLLSKPAYYLLKSKIAPAWIEGSSQGLRNRKH